MSDKIKDVLIRTGKTFAAAALVELAAILGRLYESGSFNISTKEIIYPVAIAGVTAVINLYIQYLGGKKNE